MTAWQSLPLGIAFDALIVVGVATGVIAVTARWKEVSQLGASRVVALFVFGLSIAGLFHFAVLAATFVAPSFLQDGPTMVELGAQLSRWRGPVLLISVVCLVLGLILLVFHLLPRTRAHVERLNAEIERRRQVDTMARNGEARYRAVVEDLTEMVCRFRRDGKRTFVNEAYCRGFGQSYEELVGTRIGWQMPVADRERLMASLQELSPAQPVSEFEHRVLLSKGGIGWQRWTNRAIFDNAGGIVEYQAVGRDITDLKAAEQALIERDYWHRLVTDNIPAMVTYVDSDQCYRFMNRHYQDWVSASDADARGGHMRDVLGVTNYEELKPRLLRALSGEKLSHQGTYDKDGSKREIEVSYVPHHGAEDEILGTFILVNDVTEREAARQALRKSQAQLQSILDYVPAMISLKDAEGCYLVVNRNFQETVGVSSADAVGRIPSEVWPTEFAERPEEARVRDLAVITSKKSSIVDKRYLRDGVESFVRSTKFPIFDDHGGFTGIGTIAIDITDQKIVEQALAASEERFRKAFHASPLMIAISEVDSGLVVDANQRFIDMIGLPLEEMVGTTTTQTGTWMDPTERARWAALMQEQNGPQSFQTRLRAKDDRVFDASITTAIVDLDGTRCFYTFVEDVTEQKGAREVLIRARDELEQRVSERTAALAQSEQNAKAIETMLVEAIEALREGFALFDKDDRLAIFNNRYRDFFGPDLADQVVPGMQFEALTKIACDYGIYAGGEAAGPDWHDRRLEAHHRGDASFQFTLPDGRWIWVNAHKTAGGNTIATYTDITGLKDAESELRRSEERLSSAIESISEGIILFDADERLVLCNSKYRDLFPGIADALTPGATLRELVDLAVERRQIIDLGDGEKDWAPERLRRYRESQSEDYEQKIPGNRWLHVTDRRTVDGGIVGVRTDITERKRADAEIRALNADLEARVEVRTTELRAAQKELLRKGRLETLGQLTATVSHELRNPLGAMRTSTHVLRKKVDFREPTVQRAVDRLDRSIARCDRIIDELLDFTRISVLDAKPIALDPWLNELLDELAVPAGITLKRALNCRATTIAFDPERLRRAVINLYENACQAVQGASQDKAGTVRVSTGRTQGGIEIRVEDSGPGIPADLVPEIMEPLFSTKNFGVGLGLPIVRQIVEQHGGAIEIEIEEGQGATFVVELPDSDPSARDAAVSGGSPRRATIRREKS